MNEREVIINIIHSVDSIRNKYTEITKATGANYNLFELLKIKSKEKTHTYFIADLLNPEGAHGLGDLPLNLFLETIGCTNWGSDDFTVFIEKDYGAIDPEKTQGGRIDISLESKKKESIVIENKIFAADQDKQLLRYFNSLNRSCHVLYLTLDGRNPPVGSLGGLHEDHYKCISYNEHIKEWLEKCLKESVQFPLLREVLRQYITLVNSLTGNTINQQMSQEIGVLLAQSNASIESAFTIVESMKSMKEAIISGFLQQAVEKWARQSPYAEKWQITKDNVTTSDFWCLYFSADGFKNQIYVSLEEGYYSLGILKDEKAPFGLHESKLYDNLKEYKACDGEPSTDWYPGYIWFTYDLDDAFFDPKALQTWLFMKEGLADHVIKQVSNLLEFMEQKSITDLLR